jgi:hypothetical protein
MKRFAFWSLLLTLAAPSVADAASPIEGTWAAKKSYCRADLSRAVNNTEFPLIVTEERVDWALNRCLVLKRSGRGGVFQVKARCESEGVARDDAFSLKLRGNNRLTVTFANGDSATYTRCR